MALARRLTVRFFADSKKVPPARNGLDPLSHLQVVTRLPRAAPGSGSSATLRSKPLRSSTLTSSSYFGSSSSIDSPSERSRMFLGRENALEGSEPVKLMSYRDPSESRLPITRAGSTHSFCHRPNDADVRYVGLPINGDVKKGHEGSLSDCSHIAFSAKILLSDS